MRRNKAVQVAFDLLGWQPREACLELSGGLPEYRLEPTERDNMAETTAKTTKPRKSTVKSANNAGSTAATPALPTTKRAEAKSRFNTALEEAKAGAALLGEDAKERAGAYRSQALSRGDDWASEAKTKASELAVEGKVKATEAISSLGRVVGDNAGTLDEKFGVKYGDYARTASRSLQETAAKLDQKSVEDLGNDAREFVRKSPGTAVGLAALAGFLIASVFRRR